MSDAYATEHLRSLAATRAGELVEIRRILFSALKNLCGDLGLCEGDTIRCRAGTKSHLLLETATGRTVSLERDWARFIQVSQSAGATNPAPPRRRSTVKGATATRV